MKTTPTHHPRAQAHPEAARTEYGDPRAGVALVTGASGGIGSAVARVLVARGSRVACLDLVLAEVDGAEPYVVDVTDAAAVEAAVAAVERELGPVEHLVNAAGVITTGPLLDSDPDEVARVLAVNVQGVLNVTRSVGSRMARRGAGAVVTVSSNAASTPRLGIGAYAASKAAATMLTRCLALELAPHGVRCNVVSPGSTDTDMLRATFDPAEREQDAFDRVVAGSAADFRLGIPLGRVASADDVAQTIVFLLSDAARHVTMHDLRVDGGATLGAHA